ncbi:MAG: hypothetical protein ACKO7Z_09515 [Cyanobacteriota bacterium]
MGEKRKIHRSGIDYNPTPVAGAEPNGAPVRRQPWLLPDPSGPACGLPPRQPTLGLAGAAGEEVVHARRRRRGCSAAPLLSPPAR